MSGSLHFGRAEPRARRLLVDGKSVDVGSRAFDLLLALFEQCDLIVSKAELLDRVWPGLVVEEPSARCNCRLAGAARGGRHP